MYVAKRLRAFLTSASGVWLPGSLSLISAKDPLSPHDSEVRNSQGSLILFDAVFTSGWYLSYTNPRSLSSLYLSRRTNSKRYSNHLTSCPSLTLEPCSIEWLDNRCLWWFRPNWCYVDQLWKIVANDATSFLEFYFKWTNFLVNPSLANSGCLRQEFHFEAD